MVGFCGFESILQRKNRIILLFYAFIAKKVDKVLFVSKKGIPLQQQCTNEVRKVFIR
jgi:hypothetical protein